MSRARAETAPMPIAVVGDEHSSTESSEEIAPVQRRRQQSAPVTEEEKKKADKLPNLPLARAPAEVRKRAKVLNKLVSKSKDFSSTGCTKNDECLSGYCKNKGGINSLCDIIPLDQSQVIFNDRDKLILFLNLVFGHQHLTTLYYMYMKNTNQMGIKPGSEKAALAACRKLDKEEWTPEEKKKKKKKNI